MEIIIERSRTRTEPLAAFLQGHHEELAPTAPPESRHALALNELLNPPVRLFTAQLGRDLVATGALKDLGHGHEELKSMRTHPGRRGLGLGRRMLNFLLEDARRRKVHRVSLETGSADFFRPARTLYLSEGFETCKPFGDYTDDPHSVFMTRVL
ncbi:GNAT family N-acetyltransferase [Arthrobacter sp. NPDC090010]|uniref:GNAT family N-acetyltransferase n=1 Tax=Arthrobacter sp. NPDC090010 TaxID=3363942 RepID=UPI003828F09C